MSHVLAHDLLLGRPRGLGGSIKIQPVLKALRELKAHFCCSVLDHLLLLLFSIHSNVVGSEEVLSCKSQACMFG